MYGLLQPIDHITLVVPGSCSLRQLLLVLCIEKVNFMAKITAEEIRHIAKLSRLDLTDDEVSLFGDQLSGVLEYVAELQKVDTGKVADCNNVTGLENVWRDDTVVASDISTDDVAKNAPKFENGSFVVPGVFE